jgi:hypothetical protein
VLFSTGRPFAFPVLSGAVPCGRLVMCGPRLPGYLPLPIFRRRSVAHSGRATAEAMPV